MIPSESEIKKDSERVLHAMRSRMRYKFSELQEASGLEDTRLCGILIYLLRRNCIRQELCDEGVYYCINS